MGNLVSFRPEVGPVPAEPRDTSWAPSISNDHSQPALLSQNAGGVRPASWTFPLAFRNLTRLPQGAAKPTLHNGPDAYTLVLLADQELTAGRDSQAETLLTEAYAAFDRQANHCGHATT